MTTFDYDKVRQLLAADYSEHGDDLGLPIIIGTVCITAVAHHSDGGTQSVFLWDGVADEALGLLIRHSDSIRYPEMQ